MALLQRFDRQTWYVDGEGPLAEAVGLEGALERVLRCMEALEGSAAAALAIWARDPWLNDHQKDSAGVF